MSLTFDPERLPAIAIDAHLPAVDARALTAQALRERFAAPPIWQPEVRVEPRLTNHSPTIDAAVLIAVVLHPTPTVLFTQRTHHLTDHPGQISFPGGRVEADDGNAIATALRETHEEVGLEPSRVEVIGALPTYTTTSGFVVTPVVGLVEPGFAVQSDPFEVAEVFEVPLAFLMTPANHRHHEVQWAQSRRRFLSMPWHAASNERHYFIWGATAAMLRNLYRFLRAEH